MESIIECRYHSHQTTRKLNIIIVNFKVSQIDIMNNRNNKSKKHSKLKHTLIDRIGYNSPAKFTTSTALSSGCCPKQPPNISYHHLQKKRHEVKAEYYNLGKENRCRIINNGSEKKENSYIIETTDRLREKRNTHHLVSYQTYHNKLLEAKKPSITNFETINNQQTLKSLNKAKLHTRNPITLGSMKNQKTRLLKLSDKENKPERIQKIVKKEVRQKSRYIPQVEECHLKCFQNLSSHSIAQSKVSTNYFPEINTLEDSHMIVEKQRSIQSRKAFHKSPKILSPTATIKSNLRTPEEEIALFDSKINEINTNFQHDSLTYMQSKDEEFVQSKNLNCYLGNQVHLDWKKRAMVISWMIEVMAQIGGKRETLANAVNIFDRYLSLTIDIPLEHVQCTAVASLLIAAKLEDKSLSAAYLSETTLHKYRTEQIMDEEYKIFVSLGFKVNTPTLNSWANRLAVQWDIYLESMDLRHYEVIFSNIHAIKFKNSDQTSYYNYRWLCQYIDFSIMDIYTLRYQPRMLSLAFIYLILTMRLNLATKQKVVSLFPNSSQFLFEKTSFHQFFSRFLRDSFSQQLSDLLPMIQYCSTFVILPLRFDLPEASPETNSQNLDEEINYEHFCSYQTKNQNTLPSLYSRNRSVY